MGLSDDVVRANGDWTWKPAMQQRYRRSQPGVIVGAMMSLALVVPWLDFLRAACTAVLARGPRRRR